MPPRKIKMRFDGLDVAAMVAHWNRVAIGRRVVNIYNGSNGDTYVFKLEKASSDSQTENDNQHLLLLIESGIRFHTTRQQSANNAMPTPFCSKLRKHLRGLRLEQVQQLGNYDRVINLVFGSGDSQRHSLLVEFYARGNLVLCNSKYEILALLRGHDYQTDAAATTGNANDGKDTTVKPEDQKNKQEDNNKVQVRVGHVYPITYATTASTAPKDGDENETLLDAINPHEWYKIQHEQSLATEHFASKQGNQKKKKGNKNNSSNIKWLLMKPTSGVAHYGPSLLDHCVNIMQEQFQTNHIEPSALSPEDWKSAQIVLKEEGTRTLQGLNDSERPGYIIYQEREKAAAKDGESKEEEKQQEGEQVKTLPSAFENKFLLEFQPHLLKQHEPKDADGNEQTLQSKQYPSFDHAVDAFFAHIEDQQRRQRAETQQAQAQQRLEKIQNDQRQRIDTLLEQQEVLKQQAMVVERNAELVENALLVINSALNNGMDWDQLHELIEVEQTQNQNPVALIIQKLDLEQDSMVVKLPTHGIVEAETMNVTVSLKETAFGNSSTMFAKYRASKEKSQKTIEASTKVMQAAEENARRQLEDAQKRTNLVSAQAFTKRKPLWFEKFHWFVTSDNYLVIAGKDAQQNEQLVKRYLRKGDAYLHADVHGAASCILRAKRYRNKKTGKTEPLPLSDQSLREASNFTICKSSAWKSRIITSAWWVESHQVSKTAPTGEYLTVGSFMIRGKKNFLPPSQLEMGLAVLFRLGDEESVARHKDSDRRDFALMALKEAEEERKEMEYVDDDAIGDDDDDNDNDNDNDEHNEKDSINGTDDDALIDDISELRPPSNRGSTETPEEEAERMVDVQDFDEVSASTGRKGSANETATSDDGHDSAVPSVKPNSNKDEPTKHGGSLEKERKASGKSASKAVEPPKKKKGLSVRDRKLIKKYGSLEAAAKAEEERVRAEAAAKPSDKKKANKQQADDTSTVASSQGGNVRSRKAKMKKMKKYVDQDEEDRELALLALHGGEKLKVKQSSSNNKKTAATSASEMKAANDTLELLRKDPKKVADELPASVRDILAECVTVKGGQDDASIRWDKFDADVLKQLAEFGAEEQQKAAAQRLLTLKQSTRIDNFSASLSGIIRTIRKYGHKQLEAENAKGKEDVKRKTKAERAKDDSAWKQEMAEEGIVEGGEDEDEVDDTVELNRLTSKPDPKDLILHAVPVCAPYATLSKYTYRVKLTPGNMKRGKAAKQCVEMFLKENSNNKTPAVIRNLGLIKQLTDNDWVQALGLGDVKISAAGASKLVKAQKSKSKQKSKNKNSK